LKAELHVPLSFIHPFFLMNFSMNRSLVILVLLVLVNGAIAQKSSVSENVIIITLDGMRWQEVFKGADTVLLNESKFTRGRKELVERFGGSESRQKLMPFIWNTVATEGVLLGNRTLGCNVNNANRYWFSYPGYNEVLTGYADTLVNSNDKVYNKNVTVLEYLNKQEKFKGKVAAFATWDVFTYIINAPRSGVYVNAGMDSFPTLNPTLQMLTDMQHLAPQPIGVRPDVITYMAAREYLKVKKPRVLYIAFDETDDYAHSGMYHEYLKAAHAEDAMIADLWRLIQSMPEYRNKTTLIITTDHGRGDIVKDQWKDHGSKVSDASEVWIAAIGAGIKTQGEVKSGDQFFQGQVAATIGLLLGVPYQPVHQPLPALKEILK
jgi:hypothetical protein